MYVLSNHGSAVLDHIDFDCMGKNYYIQNIFFYPQK